MFNIMINEKTSCYAHMTPISVEVLTLKITESL